MPVTDSQYAWIRLLLTLVIAMIANAGMWAIIAIMSAVEEEFDAGRALASLLSRSKPRTPSAVPA